MHIAKYNRDDGTKIHSVVAIIRNPCTYHSSCFLCALCYFIMYSTVNVIDISSRLSKPNSTFFFLSTQRLAKHPLFRKMSDKVFWQINITHNCSYKRSLRHQIFLATCAKRVARLRPTEVYYKFL